MVFVSIEKDKGQRRERVKRGSLCGSDLRSELIELNRNFGSKMRNHFWLV
jgi:hypothetical protein